MTLANLRMTFDGFLESSAAGDVLGQICISGSQQCCEGRELIGGELGGVLVQPYDLASVGETIGIELELERKRRMSSEPFRDVRATAVDWWRFRRLLLCFGLSVPRSLRYRRPEIRR